MTKKQLEERIISLENENKKIKAVIRNPFEFTELNSKITLKLNNKRLYITKEFGIDNRLNIYFEDQLIIIPNASNSFFIEPKDK